MTTTYPSSVDTVATLPSVVDNNTPVSADVINRLRDAIIAVEQELGAKPSGVYGTVRTRLDVLEALIVNGGGGGGGGGSVVFGGDLTGVSLHQVVVGIQNRSVSATLPTSGQFLGWSGTQWQPTTIPPGFTAGNDLSGTNTSQTVSGLYNHALDNAAPIQSAVPVYDVSAVKYSVRQLTEDDILPGFAISSFTFTGTDPVECGVSVVNPSFTASYASLPTSANITNTDAIDSPHSLTTPFTTGTVIGSFAHSGVNATVVFTLTAHQNAITKTATQTLYYEARSFIGVGTAGAVSATASGNTAILNGGLGTLGNAGLNFTVVGITFGPVSPTSQKIYFMAPAGQAHTFKDGNGFGFPFNSPTTFSFVNQHGATISMDLFESVNNLSSPFSILVVS